MSKCLTLLRYNKIIEQETALPTLLADPPQNMIAQSQSGTGKMAAFVIAMLCRVDPTKNYPQILCLSPTYYMNWLYKPVKLQPKLLSSHQSNCVMLFVVKRVSIRFY